jgi:hypothetical protein
MEDFFGERFDQICNLTVVVDCVKVIAYVVLVGLVEVYVVDELVETRLVYSTLSQ